MNSNQAPRLLVVGASLLLSCLVAAVHSPESNAATVAQKVATPTPGKACARAGMTVEHEFRLFTCTRLKRKLVWNSGVPIFAPVPKPRTYLDYSQVGWTNFDQFGFDLIHKLWQEKNALVTAGTSQARRELLISPNAKLGSLKPAEILDKADRFFGWINLPYRYSVFYVDEQDVGWANAEYKSRYGNSMALGTLCRSGCNGGNAMRANSEWLHMNIGAQTQREGAPMGFIELHEYTHVVQQALATSNEDFGKPPTWLVEGHANFFAQLALARTIEEYAKNRAGYKGVTRPQPIPSEQSLLDYLNMESRGNPKDGNAYNWGFYFSEALSIVYGLESTTTLYRNFAAAETFEQAVELTYGMSWTDLKPRLAAAVHYLMQPSLRG